VLLLVAGWELPVRIAEFGLEAMRCAKYERDTPVREFVRDILSRLRHGFDFIDGKFSGMGIELVGKKI